MAVQFADLHDTPGRMLEKGVIQVSCHVTLFIPKYLRTLTGIGYFRLENI